MEIVAAGRMAQILDAGPGRVLKLYGPGIPRSAVERERTAMALARERGLPVLAPGPLREQAGRWGFEMARLDGPNGMERIYAGGDVEEEARAVARLQAQVHRPRGTGLRPFRAALREKIDAASGLTAGEKAAVRARLDALPDGPALLHGDFHPGNILFTDAGPVLIDWIDAGCGDPAADVARSLVLYGGGRPEAKSPPERRFVAAYLDEYRRCSDADLSRLDDWLLVSRAARLSERAERDPAALEAAVRAALSS